MRVESKIAISVKNLRKVYGRSTVAVDNVDLEIVRGRITALLGPNGAGKTTTLKSILGLVNFDGKISIMDQDIGAALSKVSFVPEEKSFYDFLTLEKAFRTCSMIMDWFDQEKARELARTFELPFRKKIRYFSHGMKTSAYLSIALAEDAEIYILDEPTWGLDPIRRDEVLDMISEIAVEGKTVLYTSHIIPEVEKIAEVFSIMHRGKILHTGELSKLSEEFKVFELAPDSSILKKEAFERSLKKQDKITVLSDDPDQWKRLSSEAGVTALKTDLQTFFPLLIRGNSHVL